MAEIFCITASSTVAGQYVSDLPVVNEAPVARQVGFYLAPIVTATSTAYSAKLETYLGAVEFETSVGANQLASGLTVAGGGVLVATQSGTTVVTANESTAQSVAGNTLVARIIQAIALEGGALTLANLVTEIAACLTTGNAGGKVVFTQGAATGEDTSEAELIAGSANITSIGIMRILSGATPDNAGSFATTGIVGNTRLVGGKRRIYLRDRTTASLGEGFLRTYSDNGALVVYFEDGSTI